MPPARLRQHRVQFTGTNVGHKSNHRAPLASAHITATFYPDWTNAAAHHPSTLENLNMSYYTQHTLTWNTAEPTDEDLLTAIAPLYLGPHSALSESDLETVRTAINGDESVKWYDSDQHIAQVSQRWPSTVFSLQCTGEDGEGWVTFFQNGLAYTEPLQTPEFDSDKFAERATAPEPIQSK